VVFLVDLAGLDHDAVEDRAVDAEFELNYKVARIFVQLIGRPALMRGQTRVGMHSKTLMGGRSRSWPTC
jgi:Mn-dependent DtxR family transcriptional regulator